MRPLLIPVCAAAGFLAFAAPAWAQDPPKPSPDDSAVTQYVEQVPSAWGEAAPSVSHKATERAKPLPSVINARVRSAGGADVAALERNATTPSLGAPVRRKKQTPSHVIRPHDDATSPGAAVSAVVITVGDGGGARFALLGIALVAITAATFAGAVRRRQLA